MTTNVSTLYGKAQDLMRAIDQELNRPEEDAVAHFICHNSRQCIKNYLTGFLNENGIVPKDPVSLDSLLKQCQALDVRFLRLDMSPISCRLENEIEDHCEDLSKVRECYQVAQQIQQLVQA